MRENTKQTLSIALITACLAGSVFVFVRIISPARDNLQGIMGNIKIAQANKDELTKYKLLGEKLISESTLMESQINDIKDVMPSSPQTAEILATLDVLAKQNGLVLDKIDFTFSHFTRQSSEENLSDLPSLINTQLTLRGSYLGFKTFLQEVEKEKRLLNLFGLTINNKNITPSSIVLGGVKPKVTGGTATTLEYQVSLTAYYQL